MINDYGIDFVINYDVPQNKLLILGAAMDFLKDGQISSFCLDQHEAKLHKLNLCKTLRKYLFRHAKGKNMVNTLG